MANATQAFSRKPPPLSWLDLGCPLRWDPAGPIRSTRLLLSLHWGWRRPRRAVRPRSARAKVPWAGITALLLGKGKLPKVLEVGGDEGHHNPAFPQGWRKACESDESGDGTRGPSDAEKGILAKKKIRAPGSLEAPGDGVWGGRWYVLSSLRFCKLQLSRMGTVPGWLSFPPTLEPWDDREGPGTWERSRAPLLSSGTSGMAPILDPKEASPNRVTVSCSLELQDPETWHCRPRTGKKPSKQASPYTHPQNDLQKEPQRWPADGAPPPAVGSLASGSGYQIRVYFGKNLRRPHPRIQTSRRRGASRDLKKKKTIFLGRLSFKSQRLKYARAPPL
ncbi:uncharacterized protein [Castor canadensis]|uniref:Uncharacterized protein n=4 Tax=Castor canadensis TaxID=51338 RepID=A0AC58MQB1_CASCN